MPDGSPDLVRLAETSPVPRIRGELEELRDTLRASLDTVERALEAMDSAPSAAPVEEEAEVAAGASGTGGRVAMCGDCGAGVWEYEEGSSCPMCGAQRPTFPPHLQPDAPEPAKPRMSARSKLTAEAVRDYVAQQDRPFSTAMVARHFRVTSETARRYLVALEGREIIRRVPDGKAWEYLPPEGGAVTHRPRRQERIEGVGSLARGRGEVVPHTRAVGRSGRPGYDKKRAAKGVRVKRGRVGS